LASGQRPIGPRPPTPGILLAESGNITLGGWRAPAPAYVDAVASGQRPIGPRPPTPGILLAESGNITLGGWRAPVRAPVPAPVPAPAAESGNITLDGWSDWRPSAPPISKDRWVIENNRLNGVIAGVRFQAWCSDMLMRWMYFNQMPEQSRLLRWQSEPVWVRRAILICVLGREPFGKEFVDPFTYLNYNSKELQMQMQMQYKDPSVILRGYQCNQSSLDRTSTICKPLK
jgi:hypothetical protein